MAVRTGGPGPGGLSLLVVPLKGHKGVEMRRLKVQGQISAGTTFIELDDVEVPVENLIGEEGQGMRVSTASRMIQMYMTDVELVHHDQLQPRAPHHRNRYDTTSTSGSLSSICVRLEA